MQFSCRNRLMVLPATLICFLLMMAIAPTNTHAQRIYTKEEVSLMIQEGVDFGGLGKPTGYPHRMYNLHDGGQIRTHFRNYGVIGYFHPTLEWPAYSGHEYCWLLAPIIGAEVVNAQGDTVHAMSDAQIEGGDDEFNPAARRDDGFWYLNSDLVGISTPAAPMSDSPDTDGDGQPDTWPTDWTGWPGEDGIGTQKATQESFWVMRDDNNFEFPDADSTMPNGLGIEMTCRGYQWGTLINEDLLFLLYTAKNVGTQDLHKVVFGFYADLDVGYNDWLDDIADYDADRNMVYQWDEDNFTAQWDGDLAWVGLKFLESPVDPATGEQLGLTSMRYFIYAQRPEGEDNDDEQWEYMRPGVFSETPTNGGVGSDCVFIFSSGYFDLPKGESVNLAVAIVLGVDKKDILANADLAQAIYDAGYVSAEAPKKPVVRAVPGDGRVTLYWDSEPEASVDPLTKKKDFEGYKIYRSTDFGQTWGKIISNPEGYDVGYIPRAQYDLANSITGSDPLGNHFYLGDDTGIVHSWTDSSVTNGMRYWYAVTAYDAGDETLNLPLLENGRTLGSVNVVEVVPQAPPAGFKAGALEISHKSGRSTGAVNYHVLDQRLLEAGTYRLTFDDTSGTTKTYSIYSDKASAYTVESSSYLAGEDAAPVFDGIQLVLNDEATLEYDVDKSGWWTTAGDTSACDYRIQMSPIVAPHAADYEIRFTARGDTAIQPVTPVTVVPFEIWNTIDGYQADFALFPASTDTTAEMRETWTSGDQIFVREPIGGQDVYTWNIVMAAAPDTVFADDDTTIVSITDVAPQLGDVAKIYTKRPFTSDDVYELTVIEPEAAPTPDELAQVKVVPNPYVAAAPWEPRSDAIGRGPRKVYFTHLPPVCTIRIYTTAGSLIKTIDHEASIIDGSEAWDLRSDSDMDVAYGVYIYHIDSPHGETTGKVALIK